MSDVSGKCNDDRGNALELKSTIPLVIKALGLTECYLQQRITVQHTRGM